MHPTYGSGRSVDLNGQLEGSSRKAGTHVNQPANKTLPTNRPQRERERKKIAVVICPESSLFTLRDTKGLNIENMHLPSSCIH